MLGSPDTTQPLRSPQDYQALLPAQPVRLSPMQVRLLLRVVLPQPVFDRAAVLAVIAYQQRHKLAAYRSHRRRRLRHALLALQPATPATLPRTLPAPSRARATSLASILARQEGGSVSL